MPSNKRLTKDERTLRQRLAQNLVRLRKERGWSQEEAADRAGVHDKHLQKLEYGTVNITLATLTKICKGYAVDINALFHSQ